MNGAVLVKHGTYFFNHDVVFNKVNTTLSGEGQFYIILLFSETPIKSTGVGEIMNEEIKEVKKKVLTWFREERFSHEEILDPNTHFNFGIKVSGSTLHVVQSVQNSDSIFVAANLILNPMQLDLLNKMSKNKRRKFFWNLRLALVSNKSVLEFLIKPNPPEDIREIFISSKRIFYDALTKDRLLSIIYDVYKAIIMTVWILEQEVEASIK